MIKAVIFDLNGIFLQSPKLSDRFEKDFGVKSEVFLPALFEIMQKVRQKDPYGDQRFVFHNFFVFLLISFVVILVDLRIGLIFGSAYLSHIVLDALDESDYYPFFPNKRINIRGPIKYFSNQEFIIFSILTTVFFLI